MISFYGGVNGQSFEIRHIFRTKAEMQEDIQKGWASYINIGDFVLVSYGMPNDGANTIYLDNEITPAQGTYEQYRQADLKNGGKVYNSTLWQKVYNENAEGNGIGYQLIASMTGNTPLLSLLETIKASPKVMPKVIMDNTDIDNPTLQFTLPVAEVMESVNITEIRHELKPTIKLSKHERDNIVDAGTSLAFGIPAVDTITNVSATPLNPGINPTISKSRSGNLNNEIHFTFGIPTSEVIQNNSTVTLIEPNINPSVNITKSGDNNRNVTLNFNLPRGLKFFYGNQLGTTGSNLTMTSIPAGCNVGDYYINESTGRIYLAKKDTGNNLVFDYVACLQAPAPELNAEEAIPAYINNSDNNVVPNEIPDMVLDSSQAGKWQLNYTPVKLPELGVAIQDIPYGNESEANIKLDEANENKLVFNFKIPQGLPLRIVGNAIKLSINDEQQNPDDLVRYFINNRKNQFQEKLQADPNINRNYLKVGELANILVEKTIDSTITSYYIYGIGEENSNQTYDMMKATGSASGFLASERVKDGNKAYTTIYINDELDSINTEITNVNDGLTQVNNELKKVTRQGYTVVSLFTQNWVSTASDVNCNYNYKYELPMSRLTCGPEGVVSPTVVNNGESSDGYNLLVAIDAEPAEFAEDGTVITPGKMIFYTNIQPTEDISLLIIETL